MFSSWFDQMSLNTSLIPAVKLVFHKMTELLSSHIFLYFWCLLTEKNLTHTHMAALLVPFHFILSGSIVLNYLWSFFFPEKQGSRHRSACPRCASGANMISYPDEVGDTGSSPVDLYGIPSYKQINTVITSFFIPGRIQDFILQKVAVFFIHINNIYIFFTNFFICWAFFLRVAYFTLFPVSKARWPHVV